MVKRDNEISQREGARYLLKMQDNYNTVTPQELQLIKEMLTDGQDEESKRHIQQTQGNIHKIRDLNVKII